MKIKYLLIAAAILVAMIIGLNSALALGDPCIPVIKLINQDPNPATPGSYVKVLFGISGLENSNCKGLSVMLNPGYPFYLNPGETGIRTLSGNTFTTNYLTSWNVPYTIRVADDALEGDYQLKILSKQGVTEDFISNFQQEYFNLSVTDAETDFDTVIQGTAVASGTSGTQVSIGIVNTGKNTANSLVVSIPKQDNFTASGINQQIVGNLAVGDYTIVSFNILPKSSKDFTKTNAKTNGSNNPSSETGTNLQMSKPEEQNLKVKIDYTDGIGKRRSLIKEIQFSSSLISGNFTGKMTGQKNSPSTLFGIIWYYAVMGIILILIGSYVYYKKYRKKNVTYEHKNSKSDKKSEDDLD